MGVVNTGAATVWFNQQQLQCQSCLFQRQSQRFSRQCTEWNQLYASFHQSLKGLGDIENWSYAIKSDMSFIDMSTSLQVTPRMRVT